MAFSPFAARPVLLTSASEMDLDGHLRAETCLWAANEDLNAPLLQWQGVRGGVFDSGGMRIAGLSNENVAQIYDAEIGTLLRSLRVGGDGGGGGMGGGGGSGGAVGGLGNGTVMGRRRRRREERGGRRRDEEDGFSER